MSDTLYRIKPLEWKNRFERFQSIRADTLIGAMIVECEDGQWGCYECATTRWEKCDSLADGKAKAEAWYRARLMAALEEVPTCQP